MRNVFICVCCAAALLATFPASAQFSGSGFGGGFGGGGPGPSGPGPSGPGPSGPGPSGPGPGGPGPGGPGPGSSAPMPAPPTGTTNAPPSYIIGAPTNGPTTNLIRTSQQAVAEQWMKTSQEHPADSLRQVYAAVSQAGGDSPPDLRALPPTWAQVITQDYLATAGSATENKQLQSTAVAQFSKIVNDRLFLAGIAEGSVLPRDELASVVGAGDPYEAIRRAARAPTVDQQLVSKLEPLVGEPLKARVQKITFDPSSFVKIVRPGESNPGTLSNSPNPSPGGPPPKPTPGSHGNQGGGVEKLNIAFDPLGFKEVLLLTVAGKAECTATLLHYEWAITAAHCVTKAKSTELIDDVPTMISLYLQSIKENCNPPADNETMPNPCMFDRIGVSGAYTANGYDPITYDNDIALLRINPSALPHDVPIAKLYNADALPVHYTIAGYGAATVSKGYPGHGLQVGWQDASSAKYPRERIVWTFDDKNGSSICYGDSGGPLFAEKQYGFAQESHLLVAVTSDIVSKHKSPNPDISDCKNAYAEEVQVTRAEMASWICSKTEYHASGCGD